MKVTGRFTSTPKSASIAEPVNQSVVEQPSGTRMTYLKAKPSSRTLLVVSLLKPALVVALRLVAHWVLMSHE